MNKGFRTFLITGTILLVSSLNAGPTTSPLSDSDQRLLADFNEATSDDGKIQVIRTISSKADSRFVDMLAKAAHENSIPVRECALRGLGAIGDIDATYELDAIANDKSVVTEVRAGACAQLKKVAAKFKTDAALDSLFRIAQKNGSGPDFVADEAAFEIKTLLKSAKLDDLQKLQQSGSDPVRINATAEKARRDAGGEMSGRAGTSTHALPSSERPASLPEGFSQSDVDILVKYSKKRRKELSEQISEATIQLARSGQGFLTSRSGLRALILTLNRERTMLSSTDPARIGMTLEWAAIAAANRAGVANLRADGISTIDSMLPEHEVIRTRYSDGSTEDGLDAGTELSHLFLGMAAAMAQADANAAASQYKAYHAVIKSLSRSARAKIDELRMNTEKHLGHR